MVAFAPAEAHGNEAEPASEVVKPKARKTRAKKEPARRAETATTGVITEATLSKISGEVIMSAAEAQEAARDAPMPQHPDPMFQEVDEALASDDQQGAE
jgi:hypothetical protein